MLLSLTQGPLWSGPTVLGAAAHTDKSLRRTSNAATTVRTWYGGTRMMTVAAYAAAVPRYTKIVSTYRSASEPPLRCQVARLLYQRPRHSKPDITGEILSENVRCRESTIELNVASEKGMMELKLGLCLSFWLALSNGEVPPTGVSLPLAKACGPANAGIVCVNRYASVMPYHFFRESESTSMQIDFGQTSVPNDTSFGLVSGATFLVFDHDRGLEILGGQPTYEKVFNVSDAVHEAPVYVPSLNRLFVSQLAPPTGYLPQLVVDLNEDPPTLSPFLSDPPVYAPNGGTFHNGLVYWGASGGNNSIGGTEQRVGIRTLDPHTNKTKTLLNNYFGYYFNTVDDLFVDKTGAIWFTDPQYSWFNRLTDTPPQLQAASYRFDPATGAVTVIENTLIQPNGIALSPDEKHVYISDSGAETGSIIAGGPAGTPYNQTGVRAVYKYDRIDNGTHITNKRPIWYAQELVPDGLKVAANGYIVTATGKGIDILDAFGVLILRIQTDFIVQNFTWVGKNLTEFWITGQGGFTMRNTHDQDIRGDRGDIYPAMLRSVKSTLL
nr:gluconolactonase [Quercus suber]